jgi:hypothetical protein
MLSSIVSKIEIQSILDSPSMGFVDKKYANFYLKQIGKNIGLKVVIEVADNTSITRDGYTAFWKKFKGAVKLVGFGIRVHSLVQNHLEGNDILDKISLVWIFSNIVVKINKILLTLVLY